MDKNYNWPSKSRTTSTFYLYGERYNICCDMSRSLSSADPVFWDITLTVVQSYGRWRGHNGGEEEFLYGGTGGSCSPAFLGLCMVYRLDRVSYPRDKRIHFTQVTAVSQRAIERVETGALFCPYNEKSPPKSDESRVVNGTRCQRVRSIKYQDYRLLLDCVINMESPVKI